MTPLGSLGGASTRGFRYRPTEYFVNASPAWASEFGPSPRLMPSATAFAVIMPWAPLPAALQREEEGCARLRDGLVAERESPGARRGEKPMTQKITLSSSRDISLNKLVLSQSNVRRVKSGISVEQLAADIGRRGLLQSLNVRPVLKDGIETGMFEVPAGGRRFQALQLLVKQKRLAKNAPVPCIVREASTEIMAEDDSLAENVQRVPLHPLDQFRAFKTLRDKGMSDEDIAAAFFVGINVVKQRLRLASASEKLLAIFADDGMSLGQLMAFTVTDDHARQEQVWDAVKDSWNNEAFQIRQMLTERTVRASDKRASLRPSRSPAKAGNGSPSISTFRMGTMTICASSTAHPWT